MLDINKIRNEFNKTAEKLNKRFKDFSQLKEILNLDKEYREMLTLQQDTNAQKNKISAQIADMLKTDKNVDVKELQNKVKKLKMSNEDIKTKIISSEAKIQQLMLSIPNLPDDSVIVGENEAKNKEVSRWSEPTHFDFEPLAHWDLATKNGLVDFERAVKLTGSRFTLYTNVGAKLIRALIQYTLDMNSDAGFIEMLPAVILNAETLTGTGQLPKFEEDLFKLTNGYYLSPTAEVQLTNYYRNEILQESDLPYFFTANTSCFRSEAGSAGRDTKGVIRQHQFYKTEMVMISHPLNSYENLEIMTRQAEKLLEGLNLPYRRLMLCTGDIGFSAAKTYDIEIWLPSYKDYKEISSCSNCEDFQARRLKLRYKNNKGEINYVHTLNGSGLAIDRLWAAVVENYQQADGSILVPKALQRYMNGITIIK